MWLSRLREAKTTIRHADTHSLTTMTCLLITVITRPPFHRNTTFVVATCKGKTAVRVLKLVISWESSDLPHH